MQKFVFLDRNAVRVPPRAPDFPHEWVEYPHMPPEQIGERLHEATIAITNRVPIPDDTLDACPTLRLVAVSATGYDHIDLSACAVHGVAVCNVHDWSLSVPEHVFALILALRRQLFRYRQAVDT